MRLVLCVIDPPVLRTDQDLDLLLRPARLRFLQLGAEVGVLLRRSGQGPT